MTTPAPIELDCDRTTILKVDFHFLTWVFGGGVTHNPDSKDSLKPMRPHDPVTPVRSSGVRGQLRFWWRATTGARLESLEALKRREAEVWGGIWGGNPVRGQVAVMVEKRPGSKEPRAVPTFSWSEKNHPTSTRETQKIAYGAFPMRPTDKPPKLGDDSRSVIWDHTGIDYRLRLTHPPELADEIGLSVSAWLTFGGYGGRTSRGFGAVALTESPSSATITDSPRQLAERLREPKGTQLLEGVPALGNPHAESPSDPGCIMKLGKKQGSPVDAWKRAVSALEAFRQGPGQGRNEGNVKNQPGRSLWPEADELRSITGQAKPKHGQRLNHGAAFPRADFGMPIIFHFKDSNKGRPHDENSDPRDLTLVPSEQHTRLASPLILTVTKGGQPVAVHLQNAGAPDELLLMEGSAPFRQVQKHVEVARMDRLTREQKQLLEPTPVMAFLDYFARTLG